LDEFLSGRLPKVPQLSRTGWLMTMRSFHTPEAARISGVSIRTVDYWARSGVLEPSIAKARGTGSERLYSSIDVLALCVLGQFPDTSFAFRRRVVSQIRLTPDSPVILVRLSDVMDVLVYAQKIWASIEELAAIGYESTAPQAGQGVLR
jgi:hypothetical protein